jgi:DNA-directed RNA polymerase subunit RPC12/RpoP
MGNTIRGEVQMTIKFKCQQCNKEFELDTVFKYEVCPACNGNLFPVDYIKPVNLAEENEKLKLTIQTLRSLLLVVLDAADYTSGNCRPNEMVGAVLPQEVIKLIQQETK